MLNTDTILKADRYDAHNKGADAEVRIDPLDTLAQLKMKIHARQGVHPRDQVLTHNGAQLRADGMTMQALGIADGARLHLVITDISPC